MSSLRKRLRGWWRARRRRNAAARNPSPLREFVYLDEVSVYSLVASRIGAVATEFTETEIASLQTDVSASAGASVPGVAKADAKSRIGSTQTQQTQVVRKALVQSAFKELYEYESDRLRLRPAIAEESPRVRIGDLLSAELAPWVVRGNTLSRGDLLEAEVELGADAIFRMSAVVSAVTEIVYESPELRAAAGAGLEQASAIARIIEQLLVGLVPLRGRVVGFEVAALAGAEECVAHSSILDQIESAGQLTRLPLYVVGVAEEGLFWKDVRRVLFSSSRYRALCRLARPGTQRTWTPVKLVEVLGDFPPDLATQLNAATASMTSAASGATAGSAMPLLATRLHDALMAYAADLAGQYANGTLPPRLKETVAMATAECREDSIDERRHAFAQVTQLYERELAVTVDPVVAAQLRFSAWTESDPALRATDLTEHSLPTAPPEERYLDVEFVAIYW
jgi:hypothetical protein